jgi:hypothetical protein
MSKKPEMPTLTLRVPQKVLEAVERAAQHDLITVSAIARQALAKAMRERGLIDEPA